MNKYKCVMFDLDGTLVDSLQGILNAINQTFKEFNINVMRTYEEAKTFIGAGSPVFAKRAMKGLNLLPEEQERILERFLVHYKETQRTDAKLFKGIKKAVVALKERGYKVAIATNKPQMMLEPLLEQLFGDVKFDAVIGNKPNKPAKPDPYIVFEIMKELNLKDDECLYIGDSEYDYLTAHNAGIDCLIVKYGYGFYNEDWMSKVKNSVNSVDEMLSFLK